MLFELITKKELSFVSRCGTLSLTPKEKVNSRLTFYIGFFDGVIIYLLFFIAESGFQAVCFGI